MKKLSKRTTIIIISVIVAVVLAAVVVTAVLCTGHNHTFSDKWTSDSDNHWHAATCEHKSEVSDKAPHNFDANGKCTICDWSPATHTITFVADGKTVDQVTYTEGATSVTEPEVPTKEGYTGVWQSYTLNNSDITVNAVYTANEYKVTFELGSGTMSQREQNVTFDSSFTLPVPTREYYTFDGWYAGETKITDNQGASLSNWIYAEDKQVTAHWQAKEYTITFVAGDERIQRTYTVETKDSFVAPDVPEKRGYTGKWETYSLNFDNEQQVNANYTADEYKVTFELGGGTLSQTEQNVTFDSSFTLPVPTREYYTFDGWYIGEAKITDNQGASLSNWSYAEDKQATAHWQAKEYTITFVAGNQRIQRTYTVETKDSFVAPDVPEKRGYTGKWETYSLNFDNEQQVNANYTAIQYKITYHNMDGASHSNPTSYTVETGTIVLEDAVKGGFKFVGWYTNENCSDDAKLESIDANECKDIDLWAKWEAKLYETLTFGSYPQSKVEDTALQSMLNATIGNKHPSSDNTNGWTDYGYYISGKVQSYMWYIDVDYQEAKYRGVYFTSYRPNFTTDSDKYTQQDDNGYNTDTVYWFKWEPITWRILKQEDGKTLIMTDIIIDSQQYYHEDSGTRTIGGKTVHPNNYKESDIRAWLNDTFYNAAFDESDKAMIVQTEVNNSASTTDSGSNQYVCENTLDNVFLLSYREATSDCGLIDSTRRLKPSAYAQCQGTYTYNVAGSYYGCGQWLLRSPYSPSSFHTYKVNYTGGSISSSNVANTSSGVVPALYIQQ